MPSQLINSVDWGATSLGAFNTWPASLRYAWSWISKSCQPALIYCGDERICIYNDAFAEIVGDQYHPALFGAPGEVGWGTLWPLVEPEIDAVMAGHSATLHRSRCMPMLRQGVVVDTYWTYGFSPVMRLDDEAIEGVLCICTDTTIEVETARRCWETEERYQLSIEASGNIGWWDWDIVNNKLFANAQFADSFGVDPIAAMNGLPLEAYIKGIHEHDRERVQASISHAVEHADAVADEYRIIDKSGTERWVAVRGRCYADGNGTPVRFPGTAVDITARKRIENELARKEELLMLAQAAGGVGTFEWIFSNDRVYGSPMFNRLWGLPHGGVFDEGVSAATFTALVHPDDIDELPASTTKPLAVAVRKGEYRVFDGSTLRWLAHQGEIRYDAFDRPERVVGALFDITERQAGAARQDAVFTASTRRRDNAFNFVQDVVARTLQSAASLGEAQAAMPSRLRAVAFARHALNADKWIHADLRAIVEGHCADYPIAVLKRVVSSGPRVAIPPESALFLSLCLHELSANAMKYGSLSNERGQVEIAWALDTPVNASPILSFQWKEFGGPPVHPPSGRGFGTQLLASAPGDGASATQVDFDPRGLRFSLVMPVGVQPAFQAIADATG